VVPAGLSARRKASARYQARSFLRFFSRRSKPAVSRGTRRMSAGIAAEPEKDDGAGVHEGPDLEVGLVRGRLRKPSLLMAAPIEWRPLKPIGSR